MGKAAGRISEERADYGLMKKERIKLKRRMAMRIAKGR
jgi:hypothetical protein